jgi:hypothetical protein
MPETTELDRRIEEISKEHGISVEGEVAPSTEDVTPEPTTTEEEPEVTPELKDETPPEDEPKESETALETEAPPVTTASEPKAEDKPENRAQKRIRETIARQRAAEERAEALEAELAKLKAIQEVKPSLPEMPNRNDFEYEEDFSKAVHDYARRVAAIEGQRIETAQIASAKQAQFQVEQESQSRVKRGNMIKQLEEAKAKYPDYENARENMVIFSQHKPLMDILSQSPVVGELVYHLGKNLDELERISRLNPLGIAREIGRFEANIQSASDRVAASSKKITKAAVPIKPVTGSATTKGKDVTQMSEAELREWTKKELYSG